MTRSWSFSFTTTGTFFNLWNDLISKDATFTDQYFGNAPFVPSMVTELEYQNQTPGSNFGFAFDSKKEAGFNLTGASWDIRRGSRNNIDLKSVYIKTDTNPSVLYVSITAT
jgi:hypothetical protein